MLLKSTDPAGGAREKDLRQHLVNELGEEDQAVLVQWVWENHGGGVGYVEALEAIVRQTRLHGPAFVRNLLDFAKKPKEARECEQQIIAWATPRIRDAVTNVRDHRGDPAVASEMLRMFADELESVLHRMFPAVHRATVRGAILQALTHRNGEFKLEVAQLVKTLRMDDPLAASARASWS